MKTSVAALAVFLFCISSLVSAADAPAAPGKEKAAQARGKVLKFSGDVHVVNRYGQKRKLSKTGGRINQHDTVVTGKNSRGGLRFNDGAMSVLDEKSQLQVEKRNWFSYLGGKIYFTFKKVFGEPRRVRTRAATIGVRGTTFIIQQEEGGDSVALQEGLLEIDSTGPAFEIHRKREQEDFERYRQAFDEAKQKTQDEFRRYQKQLQREFIEYRRSFELKPDRVIRFSGYRVDETGLDEKYRQDFAAFEAEADELIRQFREKSDGKSAEPQNEPQ